MKECSHDLMLLLYFLLYAFHFIHYNYIPIPGMKKKSNAVFTLFIKLVICLLNQPPIKYNKTVCVKLNYKLIQDIKRS